MQEEAKATEQKRACKNCGAELKHKAGSRLLNCDYCGYEELIGEEKQLIQEIELEEYLENLGDTVHKEIVDVIACKNCGSSQQVNAHIKSIYCLYCKEPFIVEDKHEEEWIFPGAVLPFQFDKKKANAIFLKWISKVWFAPDKLKKATLDTDGLQGMYIPFWTFDAKVNATYYGQRGDYYYTTQQVKTSNGTRTEQVRHTRWSSVSGEVDGFIDDILINASRQRKDSFPAILNLWNFDMLEPFDPKYLSGYITEKYTVSLKEGHKSAREKANQETARMIRRDISGDDQRIIESKIKYREETFKHILLPIYLNSFKFQDKTYNFYINAQSGKISGKYPLSYSKIIGAVLLVIVVLGILVMLGQ